MGPCEGEGSFAKRKGQSSRLLAVRHLVRSLSRASTPLSVWIVGLLAGTASVTSVAQGVSPLPSQTQIASSSWEERREAFALLIGADVHSYVTSGHPSVGSVLSETLDADPQSANRRALGLIGLLEVENREVSQKEETRIDRGLQQLPAEDRLSEEYINYYGDVIAAVTTLRDPRSMEALVGAITTGGMVSRTLVAFGPPAVRPVAEAFRDSPRLVERSSSVRVLSDMLADSEDVSNDPRSRSAIQEVLMEAAMDESFLLRMNAVVGLVRLGEKDSIEIVERIAETDPYQAEFADNRFVVREAARKALDEER